MFASFGSRVQLATVDPSGLVYINDAAVTGNAAVQNAVIVHDDGTGSTSTPDAQWVGTLNDDSIADVRVSLRSSPVAMLRDTVS